MRVLYLYADSPQEWNCSRWNCVIPADALNKIDGHEAVTMYVNDFLTNTPEIQKIVQGADIIVFERNYFGDALTLINYWKVRGKTIIAIFDDSYDNMHPLNVSYDFWTRGTVTSTNKETGEQTQMHMRPLPLTQFKWALSMMKAIQVPSKNLALDWAKYNNTYYVRNFLDIRKYQNVRRLFPKNNDELVIGWCGSMSHFPSFIDSGLLEGLRRICKKYPQVKVLIGGDKRVFDEIPVENKIFQKYVPGDQWASLLKSLDIGLAPLYGEFDKRRSWVKVIEYLATGVPCIVSDYPPYADLTDYTTTVKTGDYEWVRAISRVIDNYPEYVEKAKVGRVFAETQNSDRNMKEVIIPLYEKLIAEPYPIMGEVTPKATLLPLNK